MSCPTPAAPSDAVAFVQAANMILRDVIVNKHSILGSGGLLDLECNIMQIKAAALRLISSGESQ